MIRFFLTLGLFVRSLSVVRELRRLPDLDDVPYGWHRAIRINWLASDEAARFRLKEFPR